MVIQPLSQLRVDVQREACVEVTPEVFAAGLSYCRPQLVV
jgi:hypothetical protein